MRTSLNQLITKLLVCGLAVWTVNPSSAQVIANNDFKALIIGEQVVFSPLANDVGGTSIALVSGPSKGTAIPLSGMHVRYRPEAQYFGFDSLRYRACNSSGICDEANVYFRVGFDPENIIDASTFMDVLLPLYGDDFDFDDDDFEELESVSLLQSPANGVASYDDDDDYIQYLPNIGFSGMDSFIVEICEDDPPCDVFLIRIQVVDTCNAALCVLPGDTNGDGIVNQDDLIGIGWSFGLNGFARPGASILFDQQPSPDWLTDFGGINSKLSDTNGDGVVTASDTTALLANYDLVAARKIYTPQSIATSPVPANLQILSDTLLYGDTVLIRISLGTMTNPGVDLYGFSASLSYNFPLTSSARSAVFDFSNSWIATASENRLTLGRIDTIARTIDFALSRTNRMGVTGFGEVITIKLITEDNIGERPGFYGEPFEASLNEGILHHSDRQQLSLVGIQQTALLFVPGRTLPATVTSTLERFRLFPNPVISGQSWTLESNGGIASVRVLDLSGRSHAFVHGSGAFQLEISSGNLERGLYLLEITESNGRRLHERVTVQ